MRPPTDKRAPPIPRLLHLIGLLLAASLLPSCDGSGPALAVDGLAFTDEELLGITGQRREQLIGLTALGLAFARDEVDSLGAPLLERREEDLLLDRFSASLVLERAEIEEAVLRAQYRTSPRHELVVRHVVALADDAASDSVHRSARSTADRALERLERGEEMAEVAADLSEEPGAAERGGRLQPGRRGTWVPEFWSAADALEEGDHTGVVRTPYGYHVIELEERRTVAFEEVRSEVVVEAGRMLGGVDEAWRSWKDSLAAEVRVDTAAVRRWKAAAFPEGAAAAIPEGGALPDTAVLATWPGGRYTGELFRRHVASLEQDRWRAVTAEPDRGEAGPAPSADLLAEVTREALRHRALREASDRNLEISAARREGLAREWRNEVSAWAIALGFQAGMPAAAIKERALASLSTTRQNATIARGELASRAPLLRAAYPVTQAADR